MTVAWSQNSHWHLLLLWYHNHPRVFSALRLSGILYPDCNVELDNPWGFVPGKFLCWVITVSLGNQFCHHIPADIFVATSRHEMSFSCGGPLMLPTFLKYLLAFQISNRFTKIHVYIIMWLITAVYLSKYVSTANFFVQILAYIRYKVGKQPYLKNLYKKK